MVRNDHANNAQRRVCEVRVLRTGGKKGDLAVRGPVSDLLLLLWNRRDTDGLQVFGDESILADWRAHVTV